MENVLASLASCSSFHVIAILKKKRLNVTSYNVEATAERSNFHSKKTNKTDQPQQNTNPAPRRSLAKALNQRTQHLYCRKALLTVPATSSCHRKIRCNPHPNPIGVKGEWENPPQGSNSHDTTHRSKAKRHTKSKVSSNAKQIPPRPGHATLSGEWLGLRAEEGRGKPRYRLG